MASGVDFSSPAMACNTCILDVFVLSDKVELFVSVILNF